MRYADLNDYYGSYMGHVKETEFQRLVIRASAYLDYYTQGKVKHAKDLDAVKMCCCALVDQYALIETARKLANKGLTDALKADVEAKSETVGDVSRTLSTGGETAVSALSTSESANKMLADTCREYLAHTGLLYRGGINRCTLPTL